MKSKSSRKTTTLYVHGQIKCCKPAIILKNRVYLFYKDATIGEFSTILSEIDTATREIISSFGAG